MTAPEPFNPVGPLPEGRVVFEASAGTGKTWNIAALVTRYVAEKAVPVEQILVVTFTRAATGELRHRIRDRLADVCLCLATPGCPHDTEDPVLEYFAGAPPHLQAVYHDLLRRALTTFDRATITTLHGFAARLLRTLGLLSAAPGSHTLAADHGNLLPEAISDMVVARFAASPDPPLPERDVALIAGAVLRNLDARIVPEPGDASGPAEVRASFARDLRRELRRRSEAAGILTYDDLLLRARDALTDPEVGELARRLIGRRYRVALIDEFQDTDPLQWDIADLLFSPDQSTLAIFGDPKQAIYAFRGADIDAYLMAKDKATRHYPLKANWRSDQPLLDGLDHLLREVTFGDPRIRYLRVKAVDKHRLNAVVGAGAPLQIRQVTRLVPVRQNRNGSLSVPAARGFVAADAAAYAVALLSGGATISPDSPPGERRLQPGDIAVLCRTHQQVADVQEALKARGVPAVAARSGDVMKTPAAGEWALLLGALGSWASPIRVRRAALTSFIGWTPEQLAQAAVQAGEGASRPYPGDETGEALVALHARVKAWAEELQHRGIPGLMTTLEAETGLTKRLLARPDGERRITDLYHIAQLLHGAGRGRSIGSLRTWLATEAAAASQREEEAESRTRRLETDAAAVQLLTIHGVKGLEFPIVLCPFLWDYQPRSIPVPVFHPGPGSGRSVDVGGDGNWPGFAEHQQQAEADQAAEEMRLMYVALTRARHHLVVWWAPCDRAGTAPISRVLFRSPGPGPIPDVIPLQDDWAHSEHLAKLAAASRGTVAAIAVSHAPDPVPFTAAPTPEGRLVAAVFDRSIDRTWVRSSFSGFRRPARDGAPAPEPDTSFKDDEPTGDQVEGDALAEDSPATLAFQHMRGGTQFGNAIHRILEAADLTAPDLPERLLEVAAREARLHDLRDLQGRPVDPQALAADLAAVAATPLFPGQGQPTLRHLAAAGWVSEMVFELPVAAHTDNRRRAVGMDDIAASLEAHLSPGNPLAAYAARLRRMVPARFRGYLTGILDVVARHPETGAYWVVDYKTTRMKAPSGEPAGAYDPGRLATAMVEHDYVLQALLYQVALHRFLRSRLPGYDPAAHLGGAMYLFLRGMTGPDTPEVDGGRRGVFTWSAPRALIEDLDAFFSRGRPA